MFSSKRRRFLKNIELETSLSKLIDKGRHMSNYTYGFFNDVLEDITLLNASFGK